jgi:hypothetical protein
VADTNLTPADERRLIKTIMTHDALPGHRVCEACRLPHPCPSSTDARQQLITAGISLDLPMTIWS